ncbi:polysaccharide pyruvyl transferase family protein [Pontixanthobacter gangjinensis]|uniref:Polysaccharide pyruvyl transferase domain-containing protein n=1 Tax=Pontixanthobacter gangjinensis TaxID=1028742 RepID=A0A6I4SSL3_9SPHN|nr:polysaccharide pyruvyl transferase family protein [Pontixanthobacter gangjinensis]MXO57502.1 hypothetical protein [Pontixanthobacter gangjinensis]
MSAGLEKVQKAVTAFRRRKSHHDAGYIGWVGKGNVGDEAMYHAARLLIGNSLEVLQTHGIERALSAVGRGAGRSFRSVILGGGTLINQDRLELIDYLADQNIRLFSLGTGVGSAGFSMAQEGLDPRWATLLSRFDKIGVRGPLSLRKLEAAGVTEAEIVGDLALALTPQKPLADYRAKRMIVNTAPVRGAHDAKRLAMLRPSLVKFLRSKAEQGWEIIPAAFDIEDIKPLTSLMMECSLDAAIVSPKSFEEYAELASVASFSLGMRLHSSVFASACGVPNVLVAYRDKCRDFAESIGITDALIEMDNGPGKELADVAEQQIALGRIRGEALHTEALKYSARIKNFGQNIRSAQA